MNRLIGLDWLRGIMAMTILVYHCAAFTEIPWATDASSVLGRLGIYGVSVFFVLSGLSMAHVYHDKISSAASIYSFFMRRIFRIWPLLTVVVAIAAIRALAAGTPYSTADLIMNATGAFGFFDPANYLTTGAWSIGNEMVFYALTPILLIFYTSKPRAGIAMAIFSVAVALVFAFHLLSPSTEISQQWATYVNPFNNLFLFCAGVSLFYILRTWNPSFFARVALIAIPIAVFAFWPASGDQISIVTGWNRVAFSFASIVGVLALYRIAIPMPQLIGRGMEWLGTISYGIYLIHPFLINVVRKVPGHLEEFPIIFVAAVSAATIFVSLAIYIAVERPMVRLGKRITHSGQNTRTVFSQQFKSPDN